MTDKNKKNLIANSSNSTLDSVFIGHPKPLFSLSMTEVLERVFILWDSPLACAIYGSSNI